jgi:hypothetical protein
LDELIDAAGEPVASEISSYTKFTRRVINMRNQFTHGDGDLSHLHMFWATRILDVVFYSVLLRELGVADDDVGRFVRESRVWRQITSMDNVWLRQAH